MFQDMHYNEQPYIKSVFYNGYDKAQQFIPKDTIPDSTHLDYKIIDSINHEFTDKLHPDTPDDTQVLHDNTFDGENWSLRNHLWIPPEPPPSIHQLQSSLNAFKLLYPKASFKIAKAQHTNDNSHSTCAKPKPYQISKKQSDSGANTSATDDITLLEDVTWIEPVNINSATRGAPPMQMTAVGRIVISTTSGEQLKPLCYYSPNVDGTIISPDAIVREFHHRFQGFRKICDCKQNTGFLTFDPLPHQSGAVMSLSSNNNLWYHDDSVKQTRDSVLYNKAHESTQPTLHKLSSAASYELWHQRLCHPGTNVMQTIHKHADNVPQQKGNSFWKCPSCMMGKCTKSYHTSIPSNQKKSKSNNKITLQDLLPDPTEEEKDDIHLPKALPGQHFHMDFGFV